MLTQWKPDNVVQPALSFPLMITPEWRAEVVTYLQATLHPVMHADNRTQTRKHRFTSFFQCRFKSSNLPLLATRGGQSAWRFEGRIWKRNECFDWRYWQREGGNDAHSNWYSVAEHIACERFLMNTVIAANFLQNRNAQHDSPSHRGCFIPYYRTV